MCTSATAGASIHSMLIATTAACMQVVQVLVAAGADVSRRNNERMNALMLGSQRGHAPIVRRLITHNAEVSNNVRYYYIYT
jgi:ankyrin repeat protein